MKDVTLEALLSSLEDQPIEKAASEAVAKPSSEGKTKTSVSDQLEGLLTKKASVKTTSEESTDMNKQAQAQGRAIADMVIGMLKKADEGSNAVIQQTEELVAQQDDATELTPREGKTVTETLKGIVERGSAEGAVHPDHLSLDAVDGDETDADIDLDSSDEYDIENEDSDLDKEAFEKLAAAHALVENGYDFETAVDLVKEAAEELEMEEFEQVKLATVQSLVGEGMDVESALDLTNDALDILMDKQASAATKAIDARLKKKISKIDSGLKSKLKSIDRRAKINSKVIDAKGMGASLKADRDALRANLSLKRTGGLKDKARDIRKDLTGKSSYSKQLRSGAAQYAGMGAAGAAAAGGAAYGAKKMREKKAAAIEALVDSGYSVEQALEILG